ncbi:MAG: hypothetical protein LBP43_05605 [Treponema sp.]|jgi:hypothetical protein|nr:hypothetical protein [Treponema sp.]
MQWWQINGRGIRWDVKRDMPPHTDRIEMSGRGISFLLTYGVREDGTLFLERRLVWPSLRIVPNNTHGSFQQTISEEAIPVLRLVSGRDPAPGGEASPPPVKERPDAFFLDGTAAVDCTVENQGVKTSRILFPSPGRRCAHEIIEVENTGDKIIRAGLSGKTRRALSYTKGTKGIYIVEITHDGGKKRILPPAGKTRFHITYSARIAHEPPGRVTENAEAALDLRRQRVDALCNVCDLDTGNPVLDLMFRFAKIRAGESIFDTLSGPFHSPGGTSFYAATWCNDEIQYAAPWFACTADELAIKASINACRSYIPFMSSAMISIPSSIIAEGLDFWELDRGDESMYAYGVSKFLLYRGDEKLARRFFPAVDWCIRFSLSRLNDQGVPLSDTDELEGRFESGKANLSTACQLYGGLRYGAILARDLGNKEKEAFYLESARTLRKNIDLYFGAEIHGHHSYRYYETNEKLRSWICLPLCVGIDERRQGTEAALFDDALWGEYGILTEEGTKTVWDRSGLFTFKAVFSGAETHDQWTERFLRYCADRLLGDHVPYAIEAYPDANMQQLSGESALFCLIITEGLLSIEPEGLGRFSFLPRLPMNLDHLSLRRVWLCGAAYDIEIGKEGFSVKQGGKCTAQGELGKRVLIEKYC